MRRLTALPLAALVAAAACSDSPLSPKETGLTAPLAGPRFDKTSDFGKLTDPRLPASPAAPLSGTTSTASYEMRWEASALSSNAGTHYSLAGHRLVLTKATPEGKADIETVPLATTTSYTFAKLCEGTYSVQVKGVAGEGGPAVKEHKNLDNHNSNPLNHTFSVTSSVPCSTTTPTQETGSGEVTNPTNNNGSVNVAPVLDPVDDQYVNESGTASFTATASDAVGQTLTFRISGEPTGATIGASTGQFTWENVGDGPNSFKFTLTVTDNLGLSDNQTVTINVVNVAPTATFGVSATTIDEGSPFTLSLTDAADVSLADFQAGFSYAFDCGTTAGLVATSPVGTASATCTTDDNGRRTVRGSIADKDGDASTYPVAPATTTVTVNNVAPVVTSITLPTGPVAVNTAVTLNAAFTDKGTADTHTGIFGLDQLNPATIAGTVTQGQGSGTMTASYTYTAAGVYTIQATVTDDDAGVGTLLSSAQTPATYVVVYDPSAGFVTGGGWIISPAKACAASICSFQGEGKASFGFVSKYQVGAVKPSGNTEFQFQAGGLRFKSASYDWLVVSGTKAQYKGEGTIAGRAETYGFMLTATDGGSADTFRMKIWDKATGAVVYDNAPGSDDIDSSSSQALGGGSIVIHKK